MAWPLLQHVLVTLLLMAIVTLICQWRRLSPAVRHALWVVVLVKLVTPPVLAWPWSLNDLWPALEPTPLVVSPDLFDLSKLQPVGGPVSKMPETVEASRRVPPAAQESAPSPALPPLEAKHATVAQTPDPALARGWTFQQTGIVLGGALWLAGAVALAGWQGRRIVQLQRQLKAARPAPRWLERMVRELAVKFDVRPPRVLVTAAVASPVLWHLGRPTLLWPSEPMGADHPTHWRGVVAHELAHLRRKDHWIGWLLLAAGLVWWWQPLYWITRRQVRLHAELACDAWVTWAFPEDRRTYAEALLTATERTSRVALAPAWGIGDGPRRHLTRRLTMIMTECVPHRVPWRTLLVLAIVAAISLPGWSTAQTPPIQSATEWKLQEQRLRAQLAELDAQKKELEAKVAEFQKRLDEVKAGQQLGDANLEKQRQALNTSVAQFRKDYGQLIENLSTAGDVVQFTDGTKVNVNELTNPSTPRDWGPEQATGAPNARRGSDDVKAWASLTQDDQDEWLLLEYANPAAPMAVMVFETYSPGAVNKLSLVTDDERELEVWKGEDPTKPSSSSGVSLIPLKMDFKDLKVRRLKVYLQSTKVPGWNEIDAVGLLDATGNLQWAIKATASSTYADRNSVANFNAIWMDPVTGRGGSVTPEQRLSRVENQLSEMKAMMEKLLANSTGSAKVTYPITFDSSKSIPDADAVRQENQRLRDELEKLRETLRSRGETKQ